MKKLRILITGSEGFIGSNLVKWDFSKYKLDLWDLKFNRSIFDDNFENAVKNNDVVYHLAAVVSVNQSFKKPEETFITNVLGTARVAY